MRNIRLLHPPDGEPVARDGWYQPSGSDDWRVRLQYELEGDEDDQYPLETLLDVYEVACAARVNDEEYVTTDVVLTGNEEDLRRLVRDIVGHRVREEQEAAFPDGRVSYRLVITSS